MPNSFKLQLRKTLKNLVVDLSVEATKEYLIKEIDEKHSNKLVLDSSKTLNKSI